MTLTTNDWGNIIYALGKTYLERHALTNEAKNNDTKWKLKPSIICIAMKKGKQQAHNVILNLGQII
jgi:hypothetical protein